MPKAKKQPEGSDQTLQGKADAGNANAQGRINAKNPAYVQKQLAHFETLSDPARAIFLQENFYLRTPFRKAGVDLNYYLGGNFPLG